MNYVIYHSKDLDGLASGAILGSRFKENDPKLIGYHYNEDFDIRKLKKKNVIIADVSFNMEKMFAAAKTSNRFVWIDHHISQLDEFLKYIEEHKISFSETESGLLRIFTNYDLDFTYVYSDKLSAAEICDRFYSEEMPNQTISNAISLLGQYDTWRNDHRKRLLSDSKDWEGYVLPFQYGMRLNESVFDLIKTFENIGDWRSTEDVQNIVLKGKAILRYQKTINQKNMVSSFDVTLGKLKGIAYNGTPFNSQTFESVWSEEKYDFMMPYQFQGKQWNVSLYTTKDDVDILSIAKSFGGGGHKQACGFQVPVHEFFISNEGVVNIGGTIQIDIAELPKDFDIEKFKNEIVKIPLSLKNSSESKLKTKAKPKAGRRTNKK